MATRTLRPITDVAAGVGLDHGEIHTYGPHMAKVSLQALDMALTSLRPFPAPAQAGHPGSPLTPGSCT